jgi:hypothetical protein
LIFTDQFLNLTEGSSIDVCVMLTSFPSSMLSNEFTVLLAAYSETAGICYCVTLNLYWQRYQAYPS